MFFLFRADAFPQQLDDQPRLARRAAQLDLGKDLHHQILRKFDGALAFSEVADAAVQLCQFPAFLRWRMISHNNSVTSPTFVVAPRPRHSCIISQIKFSGSSSVICPRVSAFSFLF